MKDRWFKIANQEGLSVSNFIVEVVEDYIREGDVTNSKNTLLKNIGEFKEQNEKLRHENIELQKRVEMLNTLTDRYEKQLQDYSNKTFIENGKIAGARKYQKSLIELFKQRSSISEDEIMDLLHIDPHDTETLKAISKQIENLEDYDVVQKIRGGWRWKK
ncbi:MAG: hypothetical protein IMZ53_01765 [Thermoplasmata archaeon]|nr:hypothetical protein [Thermoplasmata archaeon]